MEQASAEFIKNRSFEIAWAVFRCANLIKQPNLKAELENASVVIVSQSFGQLKLVEHLERLEQLVRLAEAVGEISKTNAFILFREMDNFKEVIRQRNSAIRQLAETDSAIDNIFIKAPLPLFSNDNSAINNNSAMVRPSVGASLQVVRQDNVPKNNSSAAIRQSENNSAKEFGNPPAGGDNSAILRQDSTQIRQTRNSEDFIPDDRQNGVLKKVKELGKTTTKELSSFFPDISERTIRFYLQGLCEQGLVSRVGTTGPGSYYVVR